MKRKRILGLALAAVMALGLAACSSSSSSGESSGGVRITCIKYFNGLKIVIACAHSGILLIGVNNPLIRIRISIQNHITNIACCMVAE